MTRQPSVAHGPAQAVGLTLERLATPLDHVRRSWFRFLCRHPEVRALVVERPRRLAWLAGLHGTVAFVVAMLFPVLLFLLGPVLLGVAHVAAEMRYLVLRRALHKGWRHGIWAMCGLLFGLRLWETWRGEIARLEVAMVVAWACGAVAVAASEDRRLHRALVALGLWVGLGALGLAYPEPARLFFVHAHNGVALVTWAFFAQERKQVGGPALALLGGTLLLGSGAFYDVTLASPGVQMFGLHVLQVADWLAPGVRADVGIGIVCAHAFLQSVHYMLWLVIIPQQEAACSRTLSFRMTTRALRRDFGDWGMLAVGATALAVAGCATLGSLHHTRALFLSLAVFHGYVEVVLLTYFWVRGRR